MVIVISVEDLAFQLRQASEAHHEYERRMGMTDPNWPAWYAQFVFDATMRSAPHPPLPVLNPSTDELYEELQGINKSGCVIDDQGRCS